MKTLTLVATLLLLSLSLPVIAQDSTQGLSSHYDELANLPFPGAFPTKETAATLKDELAFQRGVQTYLWSLPAMNA